MRAIQITVGSHEVPAELDTTTAAQDFASLLPLELTLTDYHGIEKVADLPRPLNVDDAPARYAASKGDITFYAPWGNLAIFYKPFRAANGLVRLGEITGSLDPLLQETPMHIRIDLAD